MKATFVILLLILTAHVASAQPELRLKNLPLGEGERISELKFQVKLGLILHLTIPRGWAAETTLPDNYEGVFVTFQGNHGVSWRNSGEEFGSLFAIDTTPNASLAHVIGAMYVEHPDREIGYRKIPTECMYLFNPPTQK